MELHCDLSPADLAYLGARIRGTTDFSPFASVREVPAEGADLEGLRKAGLIDASGRIAPEAQRPLETLARAEACSRILLSTPLGTMEKTVFIHDGDRVLTDSREDGLTLTSPVPDQEFMDLCADLFSLSSLCTAQLDLELTPAETWVFLGLCDVVRRRILEQLAGTARETRRMTAEQLLKSQAGAWTMGLTRLAAQVLPGGAPDRAALEAAVEGLKEKGAAEAVDGDVRLTGGALTAAANLLLVDSTVQIDRYTLRSGKPMGERTCCMVAGIHDIWALRPAGDRVLLRTISARALLVMLDQALTQPVGVAPQA